MRHHIDHWWRQYRRINMNIGLYLCSNTCPERCSKSCTRLRSPRTHYTGAKTTTLVASSIQTTIQNRYTQAPGLPSSLSSVSLNLVSFMSDAAGQRLYTFHSDKGGSLSSYSHERWKTIVFRCLCGTAYRHH